MLSEHMMTMWSKFSKQDDPSDHSSDEQSSETISIWPKFEAPDWKFLNFEDENLDIGQDQRERVCLFWDRQWVCLFSWNYLQLDITSGKLLPLNLSTFQIAGRNVLVKNLWCEGGLDLLVWFGVDPYWVNPVDTE